MVKPTLVVLSDNSTVTLEQNVLCEISPVLCYEDQYFTWALVFVGWAITVAIAIWQYQKTSASTHSSKHNEWVKELKERANGLETRAIEFWLTSNEQQNPTLFLLASARDIKELTTIAKDLEELSDVCYPKEVFISLRKHITSDRDIDKRPLEATDMKIVSIQKSFGSLHKLYSRRKD